MEGILALHLQGPDLATRCTSLGASSALLLLNLGLGGLLELGNADQLLISGLDLLILA